MIKRWFACFVVSIFACSTEEIKSIKKEYMYDDDKGEEVSG